MADDELKALMQRLKDAGNRSLTRELNKALARAIEPLKREVPKSARRRLPRRGGLAERIAESKITLSKKNGSVKLIVKNRNNYELRKMDDPGIIRHPVFPRRSGFDRFTFRNEGRARLSTNRKKWAWESQRIRPGWFTDAANATQPRAKREIEEAVRRIAREIEG